MWAQCFWLHVNLCLFLGKLFVNTKLRALCVSRSPCDGDTPCTSRACLYILLQESDVLLVLKGLWHSWGHWFLVPTSTCLLLCAFVCVCGSVCKWGRKNFHDDELVMQGLPVGQWAQSLFQISKTVFPAGFWQHVVATASQSFHSATQFLAQTSCMYSNTVQ